MKNNKWTAPLIYILLCGTNSAHLRTCNRAGDRKRPEMRKGELDEIMSDVSDVAMVVSQKQTQIKRAYASSLDIKLDNHFVPVYIHVNILVHVLRTEKPRLIFKLSYSNVNATFIPPIFRQRR